MIGIVLVTHGRLAEELIAALEHVVGPQTNVCAVGIGPDDDMEQRRVHILDCVANADEGDGVVLLTDMFGGTPSNLAISTMDKANVEVIAAPSFHHTSHWSWSNPYGAPGRAGLARSAMPPVSRRRPPSDGALPCIPPRW